LIEDGTQPEGLPAFRRQRNTIAVVCSMDHDFTVVGLNDESVELLLVPELALNAVHGYSDQQSLTDVT
jgi:hypothetical protein